MFMVLSVPVFRATNVRALMPWDNAKAFTVGDAMAVTRDSRMDHRVEAWNQPVMERVD
jgi:hypothetical protein